MNAPATRAAVAPERGAFSFHPIDKLVPSDTNPRKTFNEQRLAELAKTIGEHGVLEPILGRPHPDAKRAERGELEIVAGERRWRAAKLAKRPEVPVIVRPLNDKQALEIQTIENAQREDLHPLEQADGYERLIKEFGYTPEAIADAIGKSRAHVFQIRKLKQLAPKLREHFIAGEMDTTLATVFARVPGAAMQEQAWQRLKQEFREGFSFRAAAEFVRKNYMLDLARAPFAIVDSTLVAKAGACGACPKRTGNQVDLFPDVKNGNVCTDPACFAEKRAAHQARLTDKYEAQGVRVIAGAEAKKLLPNDWSTLDYDSPVKPTTAVCYDDEKRRTAGQLAKLAGLEPARLQHPHTGEMVAVVELDKLKKALDAKGIKLGGRGRSGGMDEYRAKARATEERNKLETEARRRTWIAVRAKVGRLDGKLLGLIAGAYWSEVWHEHQKRVLQAWNWPLGAGEKSIIERIRKLPAAQLARFLVDLALVPEIPVRSYSSEPATLLSTVGRKHGVQLERMRADVKKEAQLKKAAKGAAKKAKARKAPGKVKTVKAAKKGRK